MADKSKLAALIIGGLKPKGAPSSEESGEGEMPEESEMSDLDTAAQEILDSINSKDASALSEALKAFVDMC